ncbi:AMP-binding protein [Mesorhizobium sp. CAU 1732]|uniref:AMP-binding protein n=1 Tax=Mesorhizobium sp. CAU 1732 TaxID=3140358 RepID=UPI0032619EC4
MSTDFFDTRVPTANDCVLRNLLERWDRDRPEKTFARFADGSSWTYAQTLAEVRKTAAGLQALGVGQGDHVVSWLPNGPDAIRVWFAINYLGAVCVPINLAYRGKILEHIIDNSDARVMVAHGDLVGRLAGVDTARLETIVCLKGAIDGLSGLRLRDESALDGDPAALEAPSRPIMPWDLQCIMYTSGTTGPSKGVRSSYVHLYSVSAEPYSFMSSDDRYLVNLPLFHVGGTVSTYVALIRGGSIAVVDAFSASTFWEVIRETGATAATLLGSMTPLISNGRGGSADTSLRVALMIPLVEDARAFGERFGCEIYTLFNMTEISAPIVSKVYPEPLGTCGRLREGNFARIVDANDCEVAPGEVGELVVRADRPWAVSDGYHKDDAATARAWRNGWFHTGDAFRQDQHGNFFFVDRMKDAIRRRGENISSFEVEAEVSAHPGVREAAVVGVRDGIGEEEVMAIVVVGDDHAFDPVEFIEFLTPRLPHFMVPRYVRIVDDLPRTPTQKVQKNLLRDQGVTEQTWDREAHGIRLKRQKLGA